VVGAQSVTKLVRGIGEFFAITLDTLVQMFRHPWAWREFVLQTWRVARVALMPTILLSGPSPCSPSTSCSSRLPLPTFPAPERRWARSPRRGRS